MKQLIAFVAIVAALALLNPSMRDFRDYVESTMGDRMSEETDSEALTRFGAGAVALLAEQVTVRNNYLLFSTYTIDLDGSERVGNDWHFLGVANMFFQLREPESVSSKDAGSRSQ